MALKKGISIVLDVDSKISVMADPNHFDFATRNIIQNAVKFSPPDKTVKIGHLASESKNIIYVCNEGKPLSSKDLEFIKSGGYIQTSGTANERGTGLGIRLSNELLSASGGKLFIIPGSASETIIGIDFGD